MTTRPSTPSQSAAPAPDGLRGTETILLVEDEEPVRRALTMALTKYGYNVLQVEREEDAVEIAVRLKNPIHAVVTDVMMPDSDAKRMVGRLVELRPDVKVIFMSAVVEHVLRHVELVDPSFPFLQKPFHVRDLLLALRGVLDGTTRPMGQRLDAPLS